MSNSFSTISGSFVASFHCKFLSVLRDDGHFFSFCNQEMLACKDSLRTGPAACFDDRVFER